MLDFLIPRKWTAKQIVWARMKAAEFRRNSYTSDCAHINDLVALGKAVVLCDSHTSKFSARWARYERHPDPNLHRVTGNCDACNIPGPANLFICAAAAVVYRKQREKFVRDSEYARIVTTS